MKLKALTLALMLAPNVLPAWEIYEETDDDGGQWFLADQRGEAGHYLGLVCFRGETHIEIQFPYTEGQIDDEVLVFQVDDKPEHLVAGFVEELDLRTSVFTGIDRSDRPSAATPKLLREIAAGQSLYLGDPDAREAVERWSLEGSTKAIRAIQANCK